MGTNPSICTRSDALFCASIDRSHVIGVSRIIFEDLALSVPFHPQASNMSKRTATELQTASSSESKKPFRRSSTKFQGDDIGEFEDGWEDEFESDEEVVDGANHDGEYILYPLSIPCNLCRECLRYGS